MAEAEIASVRVAAAHEGEAELVVTLRHANGGLSEVALDRMAADALLTSAGAATTEALTGVSWEEVRDALLVSWNRFNPTDNRAAAVSPHKDQIQKRGASGERGDEHV